MTAGHRRPDGLFTLTDMSRVQECRAGGYEGDLKCNPCLHEVHDLVQGQTEESSELEKREVWCFLQV